MSSKNNELIDQLLQDNKDVLCLKDTLNAIDRSTKCDSSLWTQKLVKKALKLIEKVDIFTSTLQIQAYTSEKLLDANLVEMKHSIWEEANAGMIVTKTEEHKHDAGETSTCSSYNLRKKRRLNYKN